MTKDNLDAFGRDKTELYASLEAEIERNKMKNSIDELIEECNSKNIMRERCYSKDELKLSKENDIYKIAIATLELSKQGYVMCPSNATTVMESYIADIKLYKRKGSHRSLGYTYKEMIKARPTTPLDEILRGVE